MAVQTMARSASRAARPTRESGRRRRRRSGCRPTAMMAPTERVARAATTPPKGGHEGAHRHQDRRGFHVRQSINTVSSGPSRDTIRTETRTCLPETDARPARPRRAHRLAPRHAGNGAAPSDPLAPDDDSPLLAAVLAAQKTYRFGEIELRRPSRAREDGLRRADEVQARAIGPLRAGRDLIGQAQTGTGKTAAFGIPIVEVDPSGKHVQALVLTPTRELCVQVTEEIRRIGPSATSARWPSTAARACARSAPSRTPVVVGTPGRCWTSSVAASCGWIGSTP